MDHDPTQTLKKPEKIVTRDNIDKIFPPCRFWVKRNADEKSGLPERFESGWSINAIHTNPEGQVTKVDIVNGKKIKPSVSISELLAWQDDGSDADTTPRSEVVRELGGAVLGNPAQPLVEAGFEQDRKTDVRELLRIIEQLSAGTYDPSVMSGHLLRQLDLLQQGETDTERLRSIGAIRTIVDEMSYHDTPVVTSSKVRKISAEAGYLRLLYGDGTGA